MKKHVLTLLILVCAVSSGAQEAEPQDSPAVLPTEALAAAIGQIGEMHLKGMKLRSPLIAEQSIRVADAAVRTDIKDAAPMPLVLIGKLARRTSLPEEPAKRAWCNITGIYRMTCYQDLDSDGRFETGRIATVAKGAEPLTIAGIGPPRPLPSPIPYRKASPSERQTYRLVYESCWGGVDNHHFIQRVRGGGGGSLDYGCYGEGVRLSGGIGEAGRFTIDRLTVEAALQGDSAVTKLVAGIPEGTLLDRIMPGEDVVDLGSRLPFFEELEQALNRYPKPVIFATTPIASQGEMPPETPFLKSEMNYRYVGYVAARQNAGVGVGVGKLSPLSVGDPVYGVPMSGFSGTTQPVLTKIISLVWCAPRKLESRWAASCLANNSAGSALVIHGVEPAFLVQRMSAGPSNSEKLAAPVDIIRKPANFGTAITITYRISKCSDKEADLSIEIFPGGQSGSRIKRGGDGRVRFELGGSTMLVEPSGKGRCKLSFDRAPKMGESALPGVAIKGGPVS